MALRRPATGGHRGPSVSASPTQLTHDGTCMALGRPQGSAWAASFPRTGGSEFMGPWPHDSRAVDKSLLPPSMVFLCCFLRGMGASTGLSPQRLGLCRPSDRQPLSGEVEFHGILPLLQAGVQPGSPTEPPPPVRPRKVPEPGAPASPHLQPVALGCCVVGTESCGLFRNGSILVCGRTLLAVGPDRQEDVLRLVSQLKANAAL